MVGAAMTNCAAPQENGHSVAFDAVAFDENELVGEDETRIQVRAEVGDATPVREKWHDGR
jgi:hypothetical protein